MSVLELLYDYVEDRARAAAFIRLRRPYAVGLLGVLLGSTSLFLAQALSGRLGLLPVSWTSLLLILVWRVGLLVVAAALLHLLLDLTGARGDSGALLVHLGLSELAWTAALPAVLMARAAGVASPWPVRLAFLAVGLGSLALKARALSDEYGVGPARAWATLLLPGFAAALLAALAATLAAATLVLKAFSS